MPVYEFRCQTCEKVFNLTMKIDNPGKETISCPHCGSKKVTQIFSGFFVKTSRKS
jgi:putative FmdB family regulatory protein